MSGNRTLDFDDGFETETPSDEIGIAATEVQVTPTGNVNSENVQDALVEIQTDVDNLNNDISNLDSVVVTKADDADLQSHVSNTANPHAVTKAQIGLGNVDDTSDATKNAAAATLTNKTLTSPTINDPTINTPVLTGLGSTPSVPPSGFYKLYPRTDTGKLTLLDSAGTETSVGSGGTGVNFITNGDAEAGTTGWATYADAAGASPVDGTGGTANVTIDASSTSPLSGTKSLVLTKDAANRQGEGWSYAFSIDATNKARVLTVKFDYLVNSGTFAAGTSSTNSDLVVWILDVTNNVLIQPSSYKLLSSSTTIADQFQAEFQTSSNSTSYRLIFHVATTSASTWSLKVDNVHVGPNEYVFGSPVSDVVDAGAMTIGAVTTAPTKGNSGSPLTDKVRWFREGKFAVIQYQYYHSTASSSAGSGDYLFSLPQGLVADTSIIPVYSSAVTLQSTPAAFPSILETSGGMSVASSAAAELTAFLYSTTQFRLTVNNSSSAAQMSSGYFAMNNSSLGFNFTIRVPILGWGSSVQMADQTSTRVVAAAVGIGTSSLATTLNTTIVFPTTRFDSHGAYNASTGVYTVPASGYYKFSACELRHSGNASIRVHKAGTFQIALCTNATGAITYQSGTGYLNLNAGDQITFQPSATGNIEYSAGAYQGYIAIERLSGPSQIAATENISACYYLSANASVGANANINFDSREHDTHGIVTTGAGVWKATAPVSGEYELKTFLGFSSGTGYIQVYKNGSAYKTIAYVGGAGSVPGSGTTNIMLNANEYVELRPSGAITFTGGTLATTTTGHITVRRVGNRG